MQIVNTQYQINMQLHDFIKRLLSNAIWNETKIYAVYKKQKYHSCIPKYKKHKSIKSLFEGALWILFYIFIGETLKAYS